MIIPSPKLEKCPLCGGDTIAQAAGTSTSTASVKIDVRIKCGSCGLSCPRVGAVVLAIGGNSEVTVDTAQLVEAAAVWNTRA